MGIMDQLGAGLAEAGGAVQQMGMKQMESLIDQQRQEALLSMQETMRDKADTKQADRRLADDDTLTKRRESERKAKVDAYDADIKGQTSIQSDGAINLDATDQSNYRQLNPVSEADKRQAAVKAGIMEFTQADSANRNDEQNRINDERNANVDKNTVEANRIRDKRADQQHSESMGRLNAAGGKDKENGYERLPEGVKLQVGAALKEIGRLESRFDSLKPMDFESTDAYNSERDGIQSRIDANNKKIIKLLGGESAGPHGQKPNPADFDPNKKKADDKEVPAADKSASTEAKRKQTADAITAQVARDLASPRSMQKKFDPASIGLPRQ